jgi:hypothetical protein
MRAQGSWCFNEDWEMAFPKHGGSDDDDDNGVINVNVRKANHPEHGSKLAITENASAQKTPGFR